jgi:hypothetical protein
LTEDFHLIRFPALTAVPDLVSHWVCCGYAFYI